CVFFFFQAEDGIRDRNVTGVQTCALPILDRAERPGGVQIVVHGGDEVGEKRRERAGERAGRRDGRRGPARRLVGTRERLVELFEIGRASCRERVEIWGGAGECR